ncbi:STAS domain-containing protein [Neomoorella thermoacetica]|uniref:Anti-sigma-factor antagonist (STAS) domain protein n=1 Tax=Moorella thermoacetica (strain ATCC 39073 / JCM 9320) TaxID=264732 RepID=Q2RIF5_MOOTA|nr:STAS domain-containing protein [Moorella thermoacetica]AKX94258.1 RsbT antagonist protein RsbS [Moorella thermoacetica]AKX96896.1 RsbT antagonist protein RsbS [Moorella thermoacetica]OIQ54371.1 RsbT antagonist protein RsbS [Moorella thermoacetica]OIQ58066.1 RsbT antagonist protein RsbS [Moorella thermoacetica]QDA00725.1 RsbT antagonist protein RsbS [Moorella thermoacetica]
MSSRVPILKVDDYWVVAIEETLHDQSVIQFKEELLHNITGVAGKGLVIDISALEVVDSFVTRVLIEISRLAELLGLPFVLTGIKPAVAITLTEMGLDLRGMATALNLQKGLDKLKNLARMEQR